MRLFILFIFTPFFLFSQIQIGNDIDGEVAGDRSGYVSFSNDGTIVAIGGPGNDTTGTDAGYVRVFENVAGNWLQIGSDINGVAAGDNFGESVSISGDGNIIAVGASGNDETGIEAGHVGVYQNISGTWTQIGNTIHGDASNDNFGMAVSLSDDGTILSITGQSSSSYTRIYENISGVWTQVGNDLVGGYDDVNTILSGDGSVVAISILFYDWIFNVTYNVYFVYKNISGTWTQIGDVLWGGTANSLSLSYDGLIIALSYWPSRTAVYENIGNVWTQIGRTIGAEGSFNISSSLSSNGSIIAIGGISSGHETVDIFRNINNDWIQIGTTINGNASNDNFGSSLSLSASGNTVVIGANGYDGNGIDAGHVRVYDLSAVLSTNEYMFSQFKIYPNPAKDQFTIELNTSLELQKVNIYSNLGQFIQSSQEHTIVTSNLASGIYYIEVITNKGKATKKLILK